jgi:hypothetical protein
MNPTPFLVDPLLDDDDVERRQDCALSPEEDQQLRPGFVAKSGVTSVAKLA